MATTKTARWVDASAIYGLDSVKLVTANGATVAIVKPPEPSRRSWYQQAGRSHGGNVNSKDHGIREAEQWATRNGYTIVKE